LKVETSKVGIGLATYFVYILIDSEREPSGEPSCARGVKARRAKARRTTRSISQDLPTKKMKK